MSAMADEGAFVFNNRMTAYGAEPASERPTDSVVDRRLLAVGGQFQAHSAHAGLQSCFELGVILVPG